MVTAGRGGFSNHAVGRPDAARPIPLCYFLPGSWSSVNLISRSGTNSFHGSLFEVFRAEDLNAKERRLTTRTPFTYNQYGGSLGGPIKRDRIFFFAAYEGYQESSFAIVQGDVPTPKFRAEALAAQPAYKIFLDTLYLPNQPHAADADSARYVGAASQKRH